MSYVLHLGHQPSDLANLNSSYITTNTDYFFPEYDVNGLRFDGNMDNGFPFFLSFPEPTGDLWVQFFYRSPNNDFTGPENDDSHFIEFEDASGTIIARIQADESIEDWRAAVYGDTTETGDPVGIGVPTGSFWLNMKLAVGSNIELQVYLEDTLVSEAIAANTGGVGKPVMCKLPNQGLHTRNSTAYWGYAHFAVLDNVPTIGRRFIRHTPNAAGVHTDWSGVVDAIADGDITTRMSSDTAGQRQSATLTGPAVPSGTTISAVHVKATAQGGTDGVDQIAGSLRVAGTDYDEPPETVGVSAPESVVYTWDQNPDTSSGWTDADLPDEVGIISG